jgi:hypothetical protein
MMYSLPFISAKHQHHIYSFTRCPFGGCQLCLPFLMKLGRKAIVFYDLLTKKETMPTLMVWYAISLRASLSGTYLGRI